MEQRTRAALAGVAIGAIFLLVQLGALALVEPFKAGGFQTVEDTGDPTNSVLYVGLLLVATAGMLAAIKYDAAWVIRAVIVFTGGYITLIVLGQILPPVAPVAGVSALAWLGGAGVFLGLILYPEWWVIDASGIVMGAGAAGMFGVNFGVLPALVLLVVLAAYDAISVYGTEHMLTLASGVMDLKVPVVLVVPLSLSYSFIDAEPPDPTAEGDEREADAAEPNENRAAADGDGESAEETAEAGADRAEAPDPMDREALFIGLGDAVIPTVLIASAAFFAPPEASLGVPGIALSLPALTAMVGTFAGLAVLLTMVLRGRAHAGLPLLNGGAIGGYLVGALLSGIGLIEALGLTPYV